MLERRLNGMKGTIIAIGINFSKYLMYCFLEKLLKKSLNAKIDLDEVVSFGTRFMFLSTRWSQGINGRYECLQYIPVESVFINGEQL